MEGLLSTNVLPLAVTLVVLPLYLLLRVPFHRLPLHPQTCYYVPNHVIAGRRISYARGWNARFAAASRALPELAYSAIYLLFGGHAYAARSRLLFGVYNYLSAIAVGLLAWVLSGQPACYYAGLALFALVSSEPQYDPYHESPDQWQPLPQVLAVLCLCIGLKTHSILWWGLGALIWALQTWTISLTPALGGLAILALAAWTQPWTARPSLVAAGAALLAYVAWIAMLGSTVRSVLLRSIATSLRHLPLYRFPAHCGQLLLHPLRVLRYQPLVPVLAVCALWYVSDLPRAFLWYAIAVGVTYLVDGGLRRSALLPALPIICSLAAVPTAILASSSPAGLAIVAGLLAVWLLHNPIRALLLDRVQLNRWATGDAVPDDVRDRSLALAGCGEAICRLCHERSLLVYGPYTQAYALAEGAYPTSIIAADRRLDGAYPRWQRRLCARLISLSPSLVLDTDRCFNAAAARTTLGLDYELVRIFPGDFRLYSLVTSDVEVGPAPDCATFAPQSDQQIWFEDVRMALRRAWIGPLRARNWALLANPEDVPTARALAARVGLSLDLATDDPQTLLSRLDQADVVAILKDVPDDQLRQLQSAAGQRLIYAVGRFADQLTASTRSLDTASNTVDRLTWSPPEPPVPTDTLQTAEQAF